MKDFLLAVILPLLVLSATYQEVLGKKLTKVNCYAKDTQKAPEKVKTCEGNDVVCLSAINKLTGQTDYKTCGERGKVVPDCNKHKLRHRCTVCETDLCNNQKDDPEWDDSLLLY